MNPKFKIGDKVYNNEMLLEVIAVQQLFYDSKNSIQYLCRLAEDNTDTPNKEIYQEDDLTMADDI
ncbi:MAG: hypothetical protein JST58_09700 [Bacteroidetes bacterium]|nr:hypothetical protein [Bacteroidota bacterium]